MSALDLTLLPAYLKEQRWFSGKAAAVKNISLIEAMDFTPTLERPMVVAVAQVTYELGHPEVYLVPVTTDDQGQLRDALDEPSLARFLLNVVINGEQITSGAGLFRGEPIGAGDVFQTLGKEPRVRQSGVEQTNTSIVFDDKLMFKIIRKLQPGMNPELEVGRFLATRTNFRATPTLLGSLQLDGPVVATAGLLHRYIRNARDGWKYLTEALSKSEVPPSQVLGEVEAMGRCVAQLHLALGSDLEDPAFAPEPILQEDLQRWSSSIIGELGVTLALATPSFPSLPERRDALLERAQRLARVSASGLKIRQHGDLHLGQIIIGDAGWLIIDFEGEPARSFDQRRDKHSPLRDVAGMLRSFSYASTAAGLTGSAKLSATRAAREFFLRGYREGMKGSPLLPASEETFNVLLDALELEKALYEVRYELQTRPDWAYIPVESLLPS